MSVKIEASDICLKVIEGSDSAGRANIFKNTPWSVFLFELVKRFGGCWLLPVEGRMVMRKR